MVAISRQHVILGGDLDQPISAPIPYTTVVIGVPIIRGHNKRNTFYEFERLKPENTHIYSRWKICRLRKPTIYRVGR